MTILAGILTRNNNLPLAVEVCESIRHAISRHPDDKLIEFRDESAYIAKVDVGAYDEPGFNMGISGSVSLLAGDPILDIKDDKAVRNRYRDLQVLQPQWDKGNWQINANTRGVFCAVHYRPDIKRLSLIADKLSIRPLYYWVGEKYIVFASALRILEGIPIVPKEMDLRAVTEIASFGFPLSNRTPYFNIFALKSAEIVQFDEKGISHRQYWRWDQLRPSTLRGTILLSEAYKLFIESIELRLGTDRTTVAFLSGGLDSRCIVGVLRSCGATVHTFNFASVINQDRVFSAEFSRKVGSLHEEVTKEPKPYPLWSALIADAWHKSKYRSIYPAERPGLVWSGDGGSVSVGHVYISKKIVNLMRDNKTTDAINDFLQQQGIMIPNKLFHPHIADKLTVFPRLGIQEELDDIACDDAGRGFHLFLMLNDQRRHLSKHFEAIDLHRTEFHLPFFDGKLLELILSSPIDMFLEHKFYNAWLSHFPSAVTEVPWQSYPGHEKCYITSSSDNLHYQWGKAAVPVYKACKNESINQTVGLLNANDFPRQIMRKAPLHLAKWITRIGLRNSNYIMDTAYTYYRYWKQCKGKYVL